jgi:uncharacterized protein YbcC (UPF0753/DUF2309 family)
MSTDRALADCIETAAESVGSVWPLHSFVTANPLGGFEDRPFHEAVADGERLFGGGGYPSADLFRGAWDTGRIDPEILRVELSNSGYDAAPAATLERLAAADGRDTDDADDGATTATDRVDAVLSKWLAAFLDEGAAKWPMPDRERGFYDAFRTVARHDREIPDREPIADLPEQPTDALRATLTDHSVDRWPELLEHHFAALPGWTGFVKRRAAAGDAWQTAHPITLAGYLAARLALVEAFDAPLAPADPDGDPVAAVGDGDLPLAEVWLRAWERSYRSALVDPLTDASAELAAASDDGRPDAQLVFCIDTRSEILRRHVEAAGDYETHGYAGFFGVPMRHEGYDADVTVDACPPIVDARHHVADRPAAGDTEARADRDRWRAVWDAASAVVGRLRSNAATAFSFVESAGVGYGAALAARTLLPARVSGLLERRDERVPDAHEFCDPVLDHDPEADHELPVGLTLEQKVEYAATAVELMGWTEFARVVAFVGHASRTANNPFDASLDCGACAGNPGGPNARVLAAICNDEAVRERLRERGIDVPEDTVFVAGEHTTTTDEIELFDDDVPESHAEDLDRLRTDLAAAREGAAAERAGDMGADPGDGVRDTQRRAADWAETRPEWGLAGNASFVIGPRELTADLDLDGRSFLHSYDWQTDPDGEALSAIVAGPGVVTQWINAQYYFATVDDAVYGSGSKVTHNPVGNVGVYQGNGGDLQNGLPQQSLTAPDGPYHQPLRLSTVIHAPVERVTEVLADNGDVADLLDGRWLWLTVVDPTRDHRAFDYAGDLEWRPLHEEATAAPTAGTAPGATDD